MKNTANLLGVRVSRARKAEIKSSIINMLKSGQGSVIFTPNPQILAMARKDAELKKILNSATLLIPDGIGTVVASYLVGSPIRERVTGIDTAFWLLRVAADRGLSVALIGGKDGVARRAAARLKRKIPKLNIVFTHHGYFQKSRYCAENLALVEKLRQASPDIVFVCLGAPAQERWIFENRSALPSARLFMGLGGSLDIWSGRSKRAPAAVRAMGAEWLWRCIKEPYRFKRLLSLPPMYLSLLFY